MRDLLSLQQLLKHQQEILHWIKKIIEDKAENTLLFIKTNNTPNTVVSSSDNAA